jgi:hypothetical protein
MVDLHFVDRQDGLPLQCATPTYKVAIASLARVPTRGGTGRTLNERA